MSAIPPLSHKAIEALDFYQAEPRTSQASINRNKKEHNGRISEIATQLLSVSRRQFRTLPKIIRIKVLEEALGDNDFVLDPNYLDDNITDALYNQSPDTVRDFVSEWDSEKDSLSIRGMILSSEHITDVIVNFTEKNQVRSLDLSSCANLKSLAIEGTSILEGYTAVSQVNLSGLLFLSDITGLSAVKGTLTELDISESGSLSSLKGLEGCEKLTTLKAASSAVLIDVAPIKDLGDSLKVLELEGCHNIQNLHLLEPSGEGGSFS
jgi:hypothetical protein